METKWRYLLNLPHDLLIVELISFSFILFLFIEVSSFLHACEGDAVTKLTNEKKIPYFNAPIYLQNKTQIGKVDEIFGPINESVRHPLSPRSLWYV